MQTSHELFSFLILSNYMQKFNHREIGLLVTSSNEIEIGPIIKQTSSLINALTNFSVCLIPSGHVASPVFMSVRCSPM